MKQAQTTKVAPSNNQLMKGLNFLWLELTQKCNLTCVHCYADSSPHQPLKGSMTATNWKKVILNAHQEGCNALQFIGGEVTMYPELEDFIKYASEVGYTYIEVFTNATLIDQRWINLFKQYKVHLASSFYSADASVHDQITQRKGSFEKTVQGICQLVQNQIPLRIGVTEMELNQGHLSNAVRLLKALGVSSIATDRLRGVGRGHRSTTKAQTNELCGNCWKGKLCVTASGDAYPCVFSRGFKVGNVKNQSISEILHGQNLKETRATLCQSTLARKINQEDGCHPEVVDAVAQKIEQAESCSPRILEGTTKTDSCNPELIDTIAEKTDQCHPKIIEESKGFCGPDSPLTQQSDSCNPELIDTMAEKTDQCHPKIIEESKGFCGPDSPLAQQSDSCNPELIDTMAEKTDYCHPLIIGENKGFCGPDSPLAQQSDSCNPELIDTMAEKTDYCHPLIIGENKGFCGPDSPFQQTDTCNPQVVDTMAEKTDYCHPLIIEENKGFCGPDSNFVDSCNPQIIDVNIVNDSNCSPFTDEGGNGCTPDR